MSRGVEALVNEPYFFCLDVEQNFIISDPLRNNVKIVSKSGKLFHSIGKKGKEKGEFEFPCGIAISNSGFLYVLSENPSYSLQCF